MRSLLLVLVAVAHAAPTSLGLASSAAAFTGRCVPSPSAGARSFSDSRASTSVPSGNSASGTSVASGNSVPSGNSPSPAPSGSVGSAVPSVDADVSPPSASVAKLEFPQGSSGMRVGTSAPVVAAAVIALVGML